MFLRSKVRNGIALLDKAAPDWHWRINLGSLSIMHGDRCICGQLFQTYNYGLAALGLIDAQANSHGFQIGGFFEDYPKIDRIWQEEIVAKRAKDCAANPTFAALPEDGVHV
jgi:hypothetical protein